MTASGSEFDKPEKPHKKGRKKKFNAVIFNKVIQLVSKGLLIGEAVKRCGIGTTCFYEGIQDDTEKTNALKRAQIRGPVAKLAAEGYRRAIEGCERQTFYQGVECGKYREYSDTVLIFLLKKWHPEVYDDKPASFVNTVVNNPAKVQEIDARLKQADEIGDRLLSQFEARKAFA